MKKNYKPVPIQNINSKIVIETYDWINLHISIKHYSQMLYLVCLLHFAKLLILFDGIKEQYI